MNKLLYNRLRGIASVALTAVLAGFTACKKPIDPSNEIYNKLHENPHKVVYTLTEYQLPEGKAFDYTDLSSFVPSSEKPQQLTWHIKGDGTWQVDGKNELVVKTLEDDPRAIYKFSIEYFNPSGEPMNYQFVDNGQDKIHQHIFSVYENGLVVRKEEKVPYGYLYADKDKSGQYMGLGNPIGLDGFFQFKGDLGARAIKAELIHAYTSKYVDGEPSPYYAQKTRISGTKDISLELGFRRVGNTDKIIFADDVPTVDKPTDKEASTTEGINTTEVRKLKFFVGEGHFHGTDFHYLQGPQNLSKKELAVEYSMTATWQEGKWLLSGEVDKFLLRAGKLHSAKDKYPAPSFGMWIELYDKDDNRIDEKFVGDGAYQIFFRPKEIKQFSTQKPLDLKPQELLTYVYKDTDPWNKSVAMDRAKDVSANNPIGLKGFFYTDKRDVQFMWCIELWSLDKGKGSPVSPYYEPSDYVKQNGRCVLRLPIPTYIWLSAEEADALIPEDEDEYSVYPEDFTAEQKTLVEATCKLLGIDYLKLREELYNRFNGDRASEGHGEGRWF